ncbi:MAG: iron ABC transporter permease [Alphaproteobacteria bacterium]|nr:MAG: iron ABC transporter permease [Alphaproteobacteria bacterium]
MMRSLNLDVRLVCLVLAAAIMLCLFGALFIGPTSLGFAATLEGLFGLGDPVTQMIVQELRLPRLILGVAVGFSLGVSGAALQGLLRNPLADPGVVGVSASAGLGAVIAIYFGVAMGFQFAIPIMAMGGALIATLALFALASRDASVLTLILAGIGINAMATALTSLAFNFAPNPFTLQDMVMWMLGSLQNRSFTDIGLAGPFMVGGWLLMFGVGQGLAALSLGEDAAQSLGIDLRRLRLKVVLGTALCVGAAVSVCGAIGFVGLVVPHLARYLIGFSPRHLLLPSGLLGGLMILLADLLTRLPFWHTDLRLGVVTAVVGAPFFLYVVVRTRGAMR